MTGARTRRVNAAAAGWKWSPSWCGRQQATGNLIVIAAFVVLGFRCARSGVIA